MINPVRGPTCGEPIRATAWHAGPRYKWFLVAVLFVAACLNYADRAALIAIFPLLRKELGMSDVALAATSSLFLWSYALVSPVAGFLGDRFSRSSVIAWSLMAWSIILLLNGLARNQTQLLAMRIPLGIAESLYVPAAIALIGDHHSASTLGKAFSLHLCGFYAGMVVGCSLAGYTGEREGWRCPLFILGGIGILAAFLARAVLRDGPRMHAIAEQAGKERRPAMAEIRASLAIIARVPSYWFLVTDGFLLAAVSFVISTWLPLFFHESLHMDLGKAGFRGTFALQAGGIAGVMVGGVISDAVGRRNRRWRILIQAVCDLISAPMLLVFLAVPDVLVVESALLLFSFFGFMGGANANPTTCELIAAQHRSLAFGVMNLTNCLSAGAGVLLSGALRAHFTLATIFASVSGIGMLSGLVLLVGYCYFLQRDLPQAGVEVTEV